MAFAIVSQLYVYLLWDNALHSVFYVKALVGAFNQDKGLRDCEIFANLRLKH